MSVDHSAEFVKRQKITSDAFLGGALTVDQPKSGFRAGTDSVLLGASVATNAAHILDLGAGVGVAALVALMHNPAARALLCENNPDNIELSRFNLAHNGFAARAEAQLCDVTASGPERRAAGLIPDSFDCVICNPPFFDAAGGTKSVEQGRADARHMPASGLDRWVKTAASCAAPGGEVIFVHRADAMPALLAAFSRRFGSLTLLPLASRPGEPAGRILLRGIKGSNAPLSLLPPLVLHAAEGHAFTPDVKAILMGESRLIW